MRAHRCSTNNCSRMSHAFHSSLIQPTRTDKVFCQIASSQLATHACNGQCHIALSESSLLRCEINVWGRSRRHESPSGGGCWATGTRQQKGNRNHNVDGLCRKPAAVYRYSGQSHSHMPCIPFSKWKSLGRKRRPNAFGSVVSFLL